MTALRILSDDATPAAIMLLGDIDSRMLGSTRQLALERGLTVAGVLPRPLKADTAERLYTPLLRAPPASPRLDLERAIAEHEMFLLYQPKSVPQLEVDLLLNRTPPLKTLIRQPTRHRRRSLVGPIQVTRPALTITVEHIQALLQTQTGSS